MRERENLILHHGDAALLNWQEQLLKIRKAPVIIS